MNRRLLTVILILLLLVSWIICHDLYTRNKDLLNALKIADDFLEESREEIDSMSNTIERLMNDLNRASEYNKMPEHRR